MRPLQLHFLRFFTPLLDSQSKLIPMSPEIKVLCAAWASPVRLLEGKPFSPPPHSLVLTSDASQSGWGATLPPHRVSGTWSLEDSLVHINSLELKAVFLALKSLEGLVAGQSLLIRSDNTTVVSYINFQGGTHSPSLCLLAIELWEWCILRGIYLLAAHIPGKDNLVADFLSRGKFLPSEWTLNPLIFRQICQVIVPQPEIDLFASTLNFQLPKYCARCRDPQAWRVDALSFPWSGLPLYAFPPFSILPTVLEKIAREGADVALVAPFWPQRPWFLKLLSLLAGRPRALPLLKDLVYQPMSRLPHPRLESLHLTLWPLSGRRESRRDFLIEHAEFTAEALRESTRASYDSKLELFFKWCNDFTCDPYSASLGQVADFLIFLFDKGLAISTIRGYRSAIASCHRGFQDGSSISESSILTNLCKSFFLKRPPEKTLLHAWSLPVVLRALAEAPFEPLHKVSLHCLAIKTAFLVAIASGQRVSALHALSIEPGHVRWEPAGVRLVPRPNFIAKNQSPSSQPVEIFLPSMSSFSSVEADKVWCPVRALKWYLDRTKSKRSSSSLFVSSIAPFKAISKASISRWLVECISMAGPDALVSGRFRAHDTRSVSSSWALFNGASLKDIQQAAYWSSPNTFISCYLKDVLAAEASFGSAVLRSSSGSRSTSTASRAPVVSI